MNRQRIRVVKVGGSLLEWPRFPSAFQNWLATEEPVPTVLVAGGGTLVERLRRADQELRFGQVTAHWMAIEMMGLTARRLQGQLGLTDPATQIEEAAARLVTEPVVVFDVRRLLQRDEQFTTKAARLPASWDVSADSIAARLALALNAEALVLLKSCVPENCRGWREAAEGGYVDRYFPKIAPAIGSVWCVNLRDPAFGKWECSSVTEHA